MSNFELNVGEMFDQGYSIEQIAEILGVDQDLVDDVVCWLVAGSIVDALN